MRRFLSGACFVFGTVWATAGVFKLLFGVRLTLPLLPPLGLEQVSIAPSIVIGLVLYAVGAWLGRASSEAAVAIDDADKIEALLADRDALDRALDPERLRASAVRHRHRPKPFI